MKEKGDLSIFVRYAAQSKGYRVYNKRTRIIVESLHINFDELKEVMTFDDNTSGLPMYEELFNAENQSVSKSFALSDNLQQQDTLPTLNVQTTLEPIIPLTNDNAKENNNNQAEDEQFEAYEFINPFAPSGTEADESSSRNVDTSNMHTLY
ncbi:hypothetical protein Tco_0891226 [Tanacetum coccineum]|uniref:Retroviral polymerase SH3-like domain-containing protein n=1 Tax=Tanacetum coccineum TaxID=301880 RepID=A0ABQ5C440_9ASTR